MRSLMEIGLFFKTAREAAQLSRGDVLATVSVLDFESLARFEDESRPLPMDCIFTLTNLYNINPDELLTLFYQVAQEATASRKNGTHN